MIKQEIPKLKPATSPQSQDKPTLIDIVCASDTKQMASLAKPGIDEFDIRAQIAKWSLLAQAGEEKGIMSPFKHISAVAYRALHELLHHAEKGHKTASEELY